MTTRCRWFLFILCFKANCATRIEVFKLIWPSGWICDRTVLSFPTSEVREHRTKLSAIEIIPTSFSGLSLTLFRAMKLAASRWAHNRVGFVSPLRAYSELSLIKVAYHFDTSVTILTNTNNCTLKNHGSFTLVNHLILNIDMKNLVFCHSQQKAATTPVSCFFIWQEMWNALKEWKLSRLLLCYIGKHGSTVEKTSGHKVQMKTLSRAEPWKKVSSAKKITSVKKLVVLVKVYNFTQVAKTHK